MKREPDRLVLFTGAVAAIAHLWFAHHRLFESVKQYSSSLVVLNMAWRAADRPRAVAVRQLLGPAVVVSPPAQRIR